MPSATTTRRQSAPLRTKRLKFRCWARTDRGLAWKLWGDPRVTRLIGGPFSDAAVSERLDREIATMRARGVQYWPVFLRSTGEFVGAVGLRPYPPDRTALELGCHLRPEFWGQGLAEEAARAAIGFAFSVTDARYLVAGHHPENIPSGRLLVKLGFVRVGEELYPPTGLQHPLYRRDRPREASGSHGSERAEGRPTSLRRIKDRRILTPPKPRTNVVALESRFGVRIERTAPTRLLPFRRFFRGFEKVPAIRDLFGRQTDRVLKNLKVEFFSARFGYMGTSDVDGHLLISTHHLKDSDFRTVYLDVVHELCHVNQFRKGKPLFYPRLSYVDAPSEIEAYAFTVKEGRRIGMTDRQLIDYLKVEWVDAKDHRRLARRMGLLGRTNRARAHRRRINR